MPKVLLSILLIAAIAAQTFYQNLILVDYYANTASFAKNCENKTRPQLKCKGKCQMMKKIREEEQKQQQNGERKSENKNDLVLSSRSHFGTLSLLSFVITANYASHPEGGLQARPRSLFHPPGC